MRRGALGEDDIATWHREWLEVREDREVEVGREAAEERDLLEGVGEDALDNLRLEPPGRGALSEMRSM